MKHTVLVVLLAAGIMACFFQPWLRLHSVQIGVAKKLLGASDSAAVMTFTGASILPAVNGGLGKGVLKILGVLFVSVRDADYKAYLVWSVPVVAGFMAYFSVRYPRSRFPMGCIALSGLGIAGTGVYRLLQLDMDGLIWRVEVCTAFCATLAGFFFIGVVQTHHFFSSFRAR